MALSAAFELSRGDVVSLSEALVALDDIWRAESPISAQIRTAQLLGIVTPGGGAVEPSMAPFVRRLRELGPSLGTHPYRAYLVRVLLEMAECGKSWRLMVQKNSPISKDVLGESLIALELSRFCDELQGLANNSDPETRSLMALVNGMAAAPPLAESLLVKRYGADQDLVVKAYVFQGLSKLTIRLAEEHGKHLGMKLSAWLESASDETVRRACFERTCNLRKPTRAGYSPASSLNFR